MKSMYKVLATTTIMAMLAVPMAASAQVSTQPVKAGVVQTKDLSDKKVLGTMGQMTNYVNNEDGTFMTITGRGVTPDAQREMILSINEQTKIIDAKGNKVDLTKIVESLIKGDKVVKAFYDANITKSLPARGTALTIIIQDYTMSGITGEVTSADNGRLTVEGTNIYTDTKETMILNLDPKAEIYGEGGKALKQEELKAGMNITAFYGPAVTASLPAQSSTKYILVNGQGDNTGENNGGEEANDLIGTDGIIMNKSNDRITVVGKGLEGGQHYVMLGVDKDTVIVDENGKTLTADALKADVRVDAFYGPMMTMSYPGQAHAAKIVVKAQETFKIEGTIEKMDRDLKNSIYVNVGSDDNTANDLILHISEDTIMPNVQGIEDLKEGTKIVAYHSAAVTMSLPGMTNAEIIMIDGFVK